VVCKIRKMGLDNPAAIARFNALTLDDIRELREAQIERQIAALLRADGWRVRHLEKQWSEKKRKAVGEEGMADMLCIRTARPDPMYCPYRGHAYMALAQLMWIECKRIKGGRTTKASTKQRDWHTLERKYGALTLIAGKDFVASLEGFKAWYAASGLSRMA